MDHIGTLTEAYRGVSELQLQVYLAEFVFRFNRWRTPMAAFQTYEEIKDGAFVSAELTGQA